MQTQGIQYPTSDELQRNGKSGKLQCQLVDKSGGTDNAPVERRKEGDTNAETCEGGTTDKAGEWSS
jgi:hypothetical protein